MTVSHSIIALIRPGQTSERTPRPSSPSSFIMTHRRQHHITLFFQSPLVTYVTYKNGRTQTDTRIHTQPTHRANPITAWSSLVLNPDDPYVVFALQPDLLLHPSPAGRQGSRTRNQGQQQCHILLLIMETKITASTSTSLQLPLPWYILHNNTKWPGG